MPGRMSNNIEAESSRKRARRATAVDSDDEGVVEVQQGRSNGRTESVSARRNS